mmetsp:Transcript_119926/g.344619  ORF Transcript_119926/g.344619 Transcript_119926/m.344619 type:complete len:258 (-) Transcript_119926:2732-3505(-)
MHVNDRDHRVDGHGDGARRLHEQLEIHGGDVRDDAVHDPPDGVLVEELIDGGAEDAGEHEAQDLAGDAQGEAHAAAPEHRPDHGAGAQPEQVCADVTRIADALRIYDDCIGPVGEHQVTIHVQNRLQTVQQERVEDIPVTPDVTILSDHVPRGAVLILLVPQFHLDGAVVLLDPLDAVHWRSQLMGLGGLLPTFGATAEDLAVGLRAQHLLRRALLLDAAGLQDDHPVKLAQSLVVRLHGNDAGAALHQGPHQQPLQ